MEIAFGFGLAGLNLLSVGLWQYLTPLDTIWNYHERRMQAAGLKPERTLLWEQKIRQGGQILLAMAAVGIFVGVCGLASWKAQPPAMSGVTIGKRQLTQAEWNACGQNILGCYTNRVVTVGDR